MAKGDLYGDLEISAAVAECMRTGTRDALLLLVHEIRIEQQNIKSWTSLIQSSPEVSAMSVAENVTVNNLLLLIQTASDSLDKKLKILSAYADAINSQQNRDMNSRRGINPPCSS